jgi:hypothetical protein
MLSKFKAVGFKVQVVNQTSRALIKDGRRILAKEFEDLSDEDLTITTCHFVLTK